MTVVGKQVGGANAYIRPHTGPYIVSHDEWGNRTVTIKLDPVALVGFAEGDHSPAVPRSRVEASRLGHIGDATCCECAVAFKYGDNIVVSGTSMVGSYARTNGPDDIELHLTRLYHAPCFLRSCGFDPDAN